MEVFGFFIFFMVMAVAALTQNAKNKQGQRTNQRGRTVRQSRSVQYQARQQPQRQPMYTQPQRQPVYTQQRQPVYTQQQRQQPIFSQTVQKEADNTPAAAKETVGTPAAIQQPKQAVQPSGDLMKQVEELIVTGYSGNLSFKRDFIAEGIDMLNRYDIR